MYSIFKLLCLYTEIFDDFIAQQLRYSVSWMRIVRCFNTRRDSVRSDIGLPSELRDRLMSSRPTTLKYYLSGEGIIKDIDQTLLLSVLSNGGHIGATRGADFSHPETIFPAKYEIDNKIVLTADPLR